ncbi:MAG: DMT family transporter [Cohaesibacter sp.]|nr:DMT family transporter [Cohaesibacter sp.]MCV6600882.1 DMT family transporter [Cohaesibacter sp.]
MTTLTFIAVITAAALHAIWNAMVKGAGDTYVSLSAVMAGQTAIGLLLIPFYDVPDPASWAFIGWGLALHMGYQIFLLQSYKFGDLTQVYPIARGSAPLIVAGFSLVILGVEMSTMEWMAILVIGLGIMSLVLVRKADGLRNPKAGLLAFVTGCFIAAYSLVDGMGARQTQSAIAYYAWLTSMNGLLYMAAIQYLKPGTLQAIPAKGKKAFFIGGAACFIAYALVVWAFTQAPIAMVTALRETSIIFALLIGVFFLNERFDFGKFLSTALTLIGAILLRLSR